MHYRRTPLRILGSRKDPSLKYLVNSYYNFVKTFDNVELALGYNNNNLADYTALDISFSTDSYTDMSQNGVLSSLSGN